MEYADDALVQPEVAEALAHIAGLTRGWRRDEERAAATLAISVTTTPFDLRERVLAALLRVAGVAPSAWGTPLGAPGSDIVAAAPREAFLQLIDRERTYLSNVPVHTPVARVCRALVRLGALGQLAGATTLDGLKSAIMSPVGNLDTPKNRPV